MDGSRIMSLLSIGEFAERCMRIGGSAILEKSNPWFVRLDERRSEIAARGGALKNFGNYDYLGLGNHPDIQTAVVDALRAHGPSVSGSRLVGGERCFHAAFERELADFLGFGAALTTISGYLTNLSLLPHMLGSHDLVFADEFCHNSIQKGLAAAKARHRLFRHNDLDALERLLADADPGARIRLIVVESLYSMDGDVVDLPRLIEIKKRWNCWLMIDEAHSIGVLGSSGRGLCEHFGVDPAEIDIMTGSLSKTLVSSGGFICARPEVIDWLRYSLPGFVYSVGLSPVAVAAAHAALRVVRAEPERVERLHALSTCFVSGVRNADLDPGPAVGRGIVPVLFRDIDTTLRVAARLEAENIFAPPVVLVGVPGDAPRIRFFMSAAHDRADVDAVVAVLAEVGALQEPQPA